MGVMNGGCGSRFKLLKRSVLARSRDLFGYLRGVHVFFLLLLVVSRCSVPLSFVLSLRASSSSALLPGVVVIVAGTAV